MPTDTPLARNKTNTFEKSKFLTQYMQEVELKSFSMFVLKQSSEKTEKGTIIHSNLKKVNFPPFFVMTYDHKHFSRFLLWI